jgi:hypothetical protein
MSEVEVGRFGDPEDRARRGEPAGRDSMEELENLAWLLDSSITLPGTRFRIGVDSLLGLIPVLGDILGAALSSYILLLGARMGAPKVTLLRMGLNVAIESAVGVVPFLGDVFDMAWKANVRNVELLKTHLRDPARARRADWVFAILLIFALAAVIGLFGWLAFITGRALFRLFRS